METHHLNNFHKINQDIFIELCKEQNHKDELEFYWKNHNKLCCAAYLSKIKGKGNGQHFEYNVCLIKEIEEEKKNKFKENINYLGESSKKMEESVQKLKEIFKEINKCKDIFTKIRNMINEREDQLLIELDNIYDNTFFKEDIIKKEKKYQIKWMNY